MNCKEFTRSYTGPGGPDRTAGRHPGVVSCAGDDGFAFFFPRFRNNNNNINNNNNGQTVPRGVPPEPERFVTI